MKKILVIEDNRTNSKLVQLLLHSAGYAVLVAESAEAGIALASRECPHLVLMDIQLPGMDGLTATALLKEQATTRHIPVVALTALAMRGDRERILAAGCDGYIAKPIRSVDFLEQIGALLGARRPPFAAE